MTDAQISIIKDRLKRGDLVLHLNDRSGLFHKVTKVHAGFIARIENPDGVFGTIDMYEAKLENFHHARPCRRPIVKR